MSSLNHTETWLSVLNSLRPRDAYVRDQTGLPLVQIMACHLFNAKPLFEVMLDYCQLKPCEHISMNLKKIIHQFSLNKMHLKISPGKWSFSSYNCNTVMVTIGYSDSKFWWLWFWDLFRFVSCVRKQLAFTQLHTVYMQHPNFQESEWVIRWTARFT